MVHTSLAALNGLDRAGFTRLLGEVFEHSPWVAERAWAQRPFASIDALHAAMLAAVREAGADEQIALIRAHPELAGREAAEGTLTADSSSEQGRLGFTALSRADIERVERANRGYREKFGFPCIVALRLHATRESVIAEMERRAGSDRATEIAAALEQIGHITHGRLGKILTS
jgi:2-oxo-4-hydroxy-4-carboxy-5-ureidoimidazoline decarboxylase